MLLEPVTTDSNGTPLVWDGNVGNLALNNGIGNITWCRQIPAFDSEQLAILVFSLGVTACVLHLQWSHVGGTTASNWYYDIVESPGALSGVEQRYGVLAKAWLFPVGSEYGFTVYRPAAAHFFRLGVYADGAPVGGDGLRIRVERQRIAGQLQGPGT